MPWSEFTSLLAGLNHETPLGMIVDIRSETDHKIIKNFSPDQRRIRREWHTRQAKKLVKNDPSRADEQIKSIQAVFKAAFYDGKAGES